ncbi:hypothetical protein JIN84_02285 [Luteolibacter yonseiensis]|uniref:Integrin n=1 Tax=Luteolibacter yonseiensis TaxID=1144680 RepID=A0A934R1I0_9BACT|nr:hypothetical protein [Luteolibacter yonseiensis]MBK1814423.1 hypothetical protein [Luteolibacter yonseiensis]
MSITPSLHAEEPEDLSGAELDGILAAQQAAGSTAVSQKKLFRASNAEAGDYFQAVAISGDTVVVGAPFEDSNAKGVGGKQSSNSLTHSGAAYVYVRSGGKWTQQAYLKASTPGKNDQFGFSVAISGNTIVIGAFGEDSKSTGVNSSQTDDSAEESGAAYVFTRTGTTWTQQAYLKSSAVAAGNLFGYSVAIADNTLVVGAFGETSGTTSTDGSTGPTRAGAAYVFTRSGTAWTQQAALKASNPGAGDWFGISVGVSGDTLVVGAQNEASDSTGVNGAENDDSQAGAGAAYVFVRSGTTWTKQAYLKASNTGKGDRFGHSVAVSGSTVVVGAHQESSKAKGVDKNQSDNSASKSGAVYVFTRTDSKWRQQAYLKASNTGAGDGFGQSVSLSGDSMVVGAAGEDSGAQGVEGNQANNSSAESGAAYFFTRSGTKWSQKAYLKASNTVNGARFGAYVSTNGGVSVVAAPGVAKNAGAAYLFGPDDSPEPEIEIQSAAGTNLSSGAATVNYDSLKIGAANSTQIFKIRNSGTANLTGLSVIKSGTDSVSYTLDPSAMLTTVPPGGSTTFSLTLSSAASASVNRTAVITVKSNDSDEPEFKINLSGLVLSSTADTDGDGLKDYAESQYAALGFDWKIKNDKLYQALMGGASEAGLYTDVETAVRAGTPLLTKDPASNTFTLTLGLEKSSDLKKFESMSLSGSTFTTDGKLQFKFTSSEEKAAFYRVLAK